MEVHLALQQTSYPLAEQYMVIYHQASDFIHLYTCRSGWPENFGSSTPQQLTLKHSHFYSAL
jgi:hypothetical protein